MGFEASRYSPTKAEEDNLKTRALDTLDVIPLCVMQLVFLQPQIKVHVACAFMCKKAACHVCKPGRKLLGF